MGTNLCPVCGIKIHYRATCCKKHSCIDKLREKCVVCGKPIGKPLVETKTGYRSELCGYTLPHDSESARYARSFGRKKKIKNPVYCKDCGKQTRGSKYCFKCVRKHLPNKYDDPAEKLVQSLRLKNSKNVKRGKNHHWYKDGSYKACRSNNYGPGWTRVVRDSIVKRDSNMCRLCGSKRDPRYLRVHHIDFGKVNHKSSNLVTLCISCHTKIHDRFDPNMRKNIEKLPHQNSVNSVEDLLSQYRAELGIVFLEGVTTRGEPKGNKSSTSAGRLVIN